MNLTMTPSSRSIDEHRDVWDNIPWYVNGRLGEGERQRAEAHLRLCPDCREEVAVQRRVSRALSAERGVELMPTPGLLRLRRQLHAEPMPTPQQPALVPRVARPRRRHPGLVAASLALALVGSGVLGAFVWREAGRIAGSEYYTVTTSARSAPGADVRAVFIPTLRLDALQSMLADARLQIVSGPSDAGVYSLALSGSPSLEWSLQRLRSHPEVRFAERVAAATEAPP
jgi:anti-sigma factor RsiW